MKYKAFFLLVLLLGLGISGYYLYRFWQGVPPLATAPLTVRLGGFLVLAVALQLLGHYIRAYKWRLLLTPIRPTKVRTLFKGVAVGFLFNSILPFRIGEFIRADMVGRAMQISKSVVFATILMERVVDGAILVLICVLAIVVSPWLHQGTNVGVVVLGLSLVVTLVALGLAAVYTQNRTFLRLVRRVTAVFNDRLRDRLRFVAWSTIFGVRLVLREGALGQYMAWSVVMWVVYLAAVAVVIVGLADITNLAVLTYTSALSYLSVAIPSGPGYLGTYLYFFTNLAMQLISPASRLYEVAIVSWIVMIVPISLAGAVLLVVGRRPRVATETEAEAPESALRNKLYRQRDISAELSHFLDAYLSGAELSQRLSEAEVSGRVKLLRTFKGGSNAITMLAWSSAGTLVRKMTLPQHAEKLRAQYDWLVERDGLPHLPKVLGEDMSDGQYAFDIHYAPGYKPMFDYIHSQSDEANREVIRRVVRFMHERVYDPRPATAAEQNVRDYIDTKIVGKLEDTMALDNTVANLGRLPSVSINGTRYDNWQRVVERILGHPQAMRDLADYEESPIHGDLTVDNIIVNPDDGDFIILDPNNENQISSVVVDMAKLYQSLHSGYEFLVGLERAEVQGGSIRFDEQVSSRYAKLHEVLDEEMRRTLRPAEYRTLLFHEAVHYARMLTYRAKINPASLPAFYAVSVRLFNQYIDQYDRPSEEI